MATLTEKIRGKKLRELYTPSGANKDGFTDRDDFEHVVGNADFHSFQVWRSKDGAAATCVYALTITQLQNICAGVNDRVVKLTKKLRKAEAFAQAALELTPQPPIEVNPTDDLQGQCAALTDDLNRLQARCTTQAEELRAVREQAMYQDRILRRLADSVPSEVNRILRQLGFPALNVPDRGVARQSGLEILIPQNGQPGYRRRRKVR